MADIPPDDGAYPVVADAAPLLPVQPELAWDLGTETRDAVSDVYLVTFARLLPGTAEAAGLQDIVFTRVRVGCLPRLFTHTCMHSLGACNNNGRQDVEAFTRAGILYAVPSTRFSPQIGLTSGRGPACGRSSNAVSWPRCKVDRQSHVT